MLLTEPVDLPDVFQDGNNPGVKELFTAYEEELLPISEQLKRYKKRDLYSSHFYRTSYKVFGPRRNVRRIHYVEGNPFDNVDSEPSIDDKMSDSPYSITLPPYYAPKHLGSKPIKKPVKEVTDDTTEENYESWLNERKKLREGLDSFGLDVSWLERKPERTCLEDRVLTQLQRKGDRRSKFKNGKKFSSRLEVPSALIPTAVSTTLKKVAEYLLLNKLTLNIFNCGETKQITEEQCESGLSMLQQNKAITTDAIKEVIDHFYKHNESNELFYLKLTQILKKLDPKSSDPTTVSTNTLKEIKEEGQLETVPQLLKGGSITDAMALRRDRRIIEYKETLKACEEQKVSLGDALLRKVLLHPGDQVPAVERTSKIRQPGETMSENFWKADQKKRTRKKKRKDTNSVDSESTDEHPARKPGQTLITFPLLRDVLPERNQMNLSTGRALVGRKIDCWLSAEEYEKLTSTPMDTPLYRSKSHSNAFWPGHHLDKMRLWRTPCDSHRPPRCDNGKSKGSVFHRVKTLPHDGHRSNYGYDNDTLTWPTDGFHVKYGDIDQDKVYHI